MQMAQDCYQVNTNYEFMFKVMAKCNLSLYAGETNKDIVIKQIMNDLVRTPFIDMMSEPCTNYQSFWIKNGILNENIPLDYIQGNFTGKIFTGLLVKQHTQALTQNIDDEKYIENLLLSIKECEFTYLDDKNQPCGFAISYNTTTQALCAALVINPYLEAQKRTIHLFLSQNLIEHYNISDKLKLERCNNNLISSITEVTQSKSIALLLASIMRPTDTQQLELINHEKIDNFKKQLKTMQHNINNNSIARSHLDLSQPPLQLNSPYFMQTALQKFKNLGFSIEQRFFQILKKDITDNDMLFSYYLLTNQNTTIALFMPSKDVDKVYNGHPDSYISPYLLHSQNIARLLIEEGIACIFPIVEYGDYKILGQKTLENTYRWAASFFTNPQDKQEEELPKLARKHWVTIIWTPKECKFYDPKSSQTYVAKYDNTIFKTFVQLTQHQYVNSKEPHHQETFDFNNCGYYCLKRIFHAIEELQQKQKLTTITAPDIKNIRKQIANEHEFPHQDVLKFFDDNYKVITNIIIQDDLKQQQPRFIKKTSIQTGFNNYCTIAIDNQKNFNTAYQETQELIEKSRFKEIDFSDEEDSSANNKQTQQLSTKNR